MISLWTGVTCSLQEQVLLDPIFWKVIGKIMNGGFLWSNWMLVLFSHFMITGQHLQRSFDERNSNKEITSKRFWHGNCVDGSGKKDYLAIQRPKVALRQPNVCAINNHHRICSPQHWLHNVKTGLAPNFWSKLLFRVRFVQSFWFW